MQFTGLPVLCIPKHELILIGNSAKPERIITAKSKDDLLSQSLTYGRIGFSFVQAA
jgi:hypothetical protein